MTAAGWAAFVSFRDSFEALVADWTGRSPWLAGLQEELRVELGYDDYRIETPWVFNEALRELGPGDSPGFILVADNPGKNEQLSRNRRYLVGQSGKLAAGWFRRELDLDFRTEVIIINKTPIHTPKTAELRRLLALAERRGGARRAELQALLVESQEAMARLAKELHAALELPLWISGYGELGPRGLFAPYATALGKAYADAGPRLRQGVLLFRHFSMNQFAIEMRQKRDPALPLGEELLRIGAENRRRILGW